MEDLPLRFGSGNAVKRLEDELLLTGKGQFTDDFLLPHQAYLSFLRSPLAHAKIISINTDHAKSMPGVKLVLCGEDIQHLKPLPQPTNFKTREGKNSQTAPHFLLAQDTVRYVGQCIALVVAESLAQAKNATDAIELELEELPCVVDVLEALNSDSIQVGVSSGNSIAYTQYGDEQATEQVIQQAKHKVSLQIVHQRLCALSIEPRSVLAYLDNERLTIRLGSQMPTAVRTQVSHILGLSTDQVRVIVGDVGGGFGMKTGCYPEDVLVAYCTWVLRTPVKWVALRNEEFLSSAHGRDVTSHLELALAEDGKFLALRLRGLANVGAYPTASAIAIPLMIGPWVQTSIYDIPLIDFQFQAVLTHTSMMGAYRGAGRPESIYNIERLIDEAARQTGMDRIYLRQRNFIKPEQMPYTNAMGKVYDCGDFETILQQTLTLASWHDLLSKNATPGKWRGIGIATFLEWTGGNALTETVQAQIKSNGEVEVFTAVNPMGQGIATSLAQLVVDIFQIPIDKVRIVMGDTDQGNGFGSAGSRSLFTGGAAVFNGAIELFEKTKKLASEDLEVAIDDLEYKLGEFSVKGTDIRTNLSNLAQKQSNQVIQLESTTSASAPTWPNGCHICEIELDPETGQVEILSYYSVNDIGRVVNPLIVTGQLDGGAVQGIGQALYEKVIYDSQSGQNLTGSLMDYCAPRADCMSGHFITHTNQNYPTKTNILGVKGVGELGTIGATPAVFNAVAHALYQQGRGHVASQLQLPITANQLWELLHA
ncbi:MAG: xanthine dehydrogenase family protein molybdopterin-binding subunit [Gammaproteobacteria bacterium]|nr:xanthine dehydrogenase family protein molybdopterin-binding subunit [Gammaproteobacteria bacterium]